MFTFLNSVLAWSLLAAAIPILIHLFTRKKLKRIPFSSLKFLQAMQKEKIRQVKIKQIILLILRTLIILLLVAAFLRPTLKTSDFVVGQRARASMVLIVDNSLSMAITRRGQSRMTEAKLQAQELLKIGQPGDEMSIVSAGYPARLLNDSPAMDKNEAFLLIDKIEQHASSTDLPGALALAAEILGKSNNLNKEIYLFSDNRAVLENAGSLNLHEQNIRLFVQEWPEEQQRNLMLSEIKFNNQIFEVRKPVEVRVTVSNTGPVDENGRMAYLLLNGNRVAQSQVDVPAGEARSVTFRVVPEEGGYQLLTAELENDALSLDNRRYALFYIQEQIRALLVGASPDDRLFVRLALQQAVHDGSLQIQEIESNRLARAKWQDHDVVVFCNVPAFDAIAGYKLQSYLENGGGVVLFLGNDVDLRNYNEQIFARFNLGRLGESLGSFTNGESILRLGEINTDHPIFQGVFSDEEEKQKIESPDFRFVVNTYPDKNTGVIIRYSNNSPFLLERSVKDGLLLAYLSSADADWSDIAFKGIFAPLVNRSVRYVAGQGGVPGKELLAGQQALASIAGENLAQFSVVSPDQASQRLRPKIVDGRYTVTVDNTRQTGFYKLLGDEKEKFIWAVNFDPLEMKTEPLQKETFQQLVGEKNVIMLSTNEPMHASLQAWRYGQELWQFFLWLALLGLLAEMLLFRAKGEQLQ
jgi:hypothetical protein